MRRADTRSTTRLKNLAWMESWSMSRLVEPQDCPWWVKFMPATAPLTAWSRSASGNTIMGFLPPSSRVMCLTPTSAAARWIIIPVGTEPMKAMRLIPGWRMMASPATGPVPVTMFTRPGGSTRAQTSARIEADNGACSGGLMMTLLPAIKGAARRGIGQTAQPERTAVTCHPLRRRGIWA